MTKSTGKTTCQHFEQQLNAFVDGELKNLEVQRVVAHLETCSTCRLYVDELRAFAQMHRDCHDSEAILRTIDAPSIFQNITGTLLDEKIGKLSELFYQVGKAYVLKGSKRKRNFNEELLSKPKPINLTKQKAKRLLDETSELTRLNSSYEKVLKKARSFFRKDKRSRNDLVAIGRRFLEESLTIDPKRPEPRIYLGFSCILERRYDRAREQLRKVLAQPEASEQNRMIAIQNMGFLNLLERRYDDAVNCFREVEKSELIKKQPNFGYRLLTDLATAYAKASNYDKSIEYFSRIVNEFPSKVVEIRKDLFAMDTFQNLLRTQAVFREKLEKRIPVLFAS